MSERHIAVKELEDLYPEWRKHPEAEKIKEALSKLNYGEVLTYEPCPGPHGPMKAHPSEWVCNFQARISGLARTLKLRFSTRHIGNIKTDKQCPLIVFPRKGKSGL